MLKGVRDWWKKVLVAVCMIGLIIFSGDYAFAQAAPSVPEQSFLKPTDKQLQLQPNPYVTEKPFSASKNKKNQLLIPCVPGTQCVSLPTTPPPVKDKPHLPAGKETEAEE